MSPKANKSSEVLFTQSATPPEKQIRSIGCLSISLLLVLVRTASASCVNSVSPTDWARISAIASVILDRVPASVLLPTAILAPILSAISWAEGAMYWIVPSLSSRIRRPPMS